MLIEKLKGIPRLSREEELDLWHQYRNGSGTARDKILRCHLHYVAQISRQMHNKTGLNIDDLFSAGCLGLMRAFPKFDESRGTRFVTYAAFWIKNEIVTEIRHKYTNGLIGEGKPTDKMAEFSEDYNYTVNTDEPEVVCIQKEIHQITKDSLKALKPREQRIIKERYWGEQTFADVGRKLDLSRERIRQLELESLDKLKYRLEKRI